MQEALPLKGIALFLKILHDWFPVLQTLHLRSVVISEIKKVLNCRNPKNGTMYCCDRCNQIRWVPFTCKSRFCPSCGNLYNMQRANALTERMFDVPHRHVVFTISDVLRHYFLEDRSLLNVLFDAAAQTYKIVVAQGFSGSLTPGIICVLHTFSRSSDWNPHVHCLATEGGLTKWGAWRKRPFMLCYKPGKENWLISERQTRKMPKETLTDSSFHPPRVHKTLLFLFLADNDKVPDIFYNMSH